MRRNPHEAGDKAERVQRMFAAIAKRYDLNNRLHSFGRDQAWRRAAVRLAGVGPDDDVLDAACGTGDLAIAFSRAGAASVTGLDFTEEMLELARAKARAKARERGSALRFVRGDAMSLPFDDAAFDIVSIAFGIRNVSDAGAALREFRRVLRPGGRLVILEFATPRNPLIRAFNRLYCERLMPLTATLIARDRSGAYRYLPRSVSTFMDPAAMQQAMAAAGFGSIMRRPMTFGVCVAYRGVAGGGAAAR